MAQALAVAKVHASSVGVVRGRGNLGVRVLADAYISTRAAIEPGWSNTTQIRYSCKVSKRFIMSPVPAEIDRGALQKILDSFLWPSVLLRQTGPNTWIIGCETEPPSETITIRGCLVLITKCPAKDDVKGSSSAVLAAPQHVKKSLDRQFQAGVRQSLPEGSGQTRPDPPTPAVPFQDARLDELREEMNQKLIAVSGQFQRTVEGLQGSLDSKFGAVQQAHAELRQAVAEGVCSKTDMSQLLAEALARQSAEFRQMMSKRTPDPSPVNQEASKAAKHQ